MAFCTDDSHLEAGAAASERPPPLAGRVWNSPAMARPPFAARGRTGTRPEGRGGGSEEWAEGAQVEVEVVVGEVEVVFEAGHGLFEAHQSEAEPFDLLVGEVAVFGAA